jgi:LysM repeat protein
MIQKIFHSSRLVPLASLLILLALLFSVVPGAVFDVQAATQKPACKLFYTVKSGDTLNLIAKKYNLDVFKLVEANPLGDTRWIYVMQSLCIPVTSKPYQSNVPGWTNNPAGDYTAKRVGKTVIIEATNFPKNNTYYVKMDRQLTVSKAMKKIGLFKTGEKKSTKATYMIPNSLRTGQLYVCLKENAYTRNNICRPVTR